jgi:hypothetical protein
MFKIFLEPQISTIIILPMYNKYVNIYVYSINVKAIMGNGILLKMGLF